MSRTYKGKLKSSRLKANTKCPTGQKLREEMRKKLKEVLKTGRSKELSKRRDRYTGVINKEQTDFSEENRNELDGGEPMPNVDEMLKILEDVELELAQNVLQDEAEQYSLYTEAETNALIDHFLNVCTICNKVTEIQTSTSSVICDQCARLHFDSEQL